MENVSFSIVIPVYNVENTLKRCVMSAVNQNYNKLEVIVINDGSTDHSGEIADKLEEHYSSITVYHKVNGGLSDARNFGILKSKNDYIIFLDSDDFIQENTCQKINETINNIGTYPDIIAGGYTKHHNDLLTKKSRVTINQYVLSGKEFLLNELEASNFQVTAVSSVYKREYLIKNRIFFPVNLLHEDEYFTPIAFLSASTVVSTDILFYNYIIRENSITTSKDLTKNAISIFEISRRLTEVYEKINEKELRILLKSHLAKICFKAIEDARLYEKSKRNIIDYNVIKKNSILVYEKIRYLLLKINPKLLHYVIFFIKG